MYTLAGLGIIFLLFIIIEEKKTYPIAQTYEEFRRLLLHVENKQYLPEIASV